MATTTRKPVPANPFEQFNWEPQPAAQQLIDSIIDEFLSRCPGAQTVAHKMTRETATRFKDWVDYIQMPRSEDIKKKLTGVGFVRRAVPGAPDRYVHEGAIFPQVILFEGKITRVGIKVDSVVDFLSAWHIADDPTLTEDDIEGDPGAPLRRARAYTGDNSQLWCVERHGYRGFATVEVAPERVVQTMRHLEGFRRRARDWADDDLGLDHTEALVDAAVADLGPDLACDLFFAAEREYWQRRNRAAQVQKSRQDKLGLGWANHDHHTYRTSRHCFTQVIRIFEKLGFHCRERFYAGNEAGWGAQVIEQPTAGIVIFADVDMSAEEVLGDFAHEPMPEREELGTVGLWCALHGDALLQAGMHHLECMFDHDALVTQLEAAAIDTMEPFTNFPFLKQAFTKGEWWPVSEKRLERLVQQGKLTPQQAHQFRMQGGAIGSHLENLERNNGYKGFNQQGVSQIIAKTDPRKQAAARIGA